MTTKFVTRNDEVFRILIEKEDAMWLISYDNPTSPPFCLAVSEMSSFQRISAPLDFVSGTKTNSKAETERVELISPLTNNYEMAITDRQWRLKTSNDIASAHGTTGKRVLRIFYRYLATDRTVAPKNRQKTNIKENYDWAIKTFYFSAKKMSLKGAYDMMLVRRYTGADGKLLENVPTWHSFRNYYYTRNYHKQPGKVIARTGLTNYQRNKRPAFGSTSDWREHPGSYQMDATLADIYLVSRHDRNIVIGRPHIYLAVDSATHLIAGFYVGFACDEAAVMLCLSNAAEDKVSYCGEYGIEIDSGQWPNHGFPNEIVTDRGREFLGPRMEELCRRYGVEVQSLPPFRPDEKGVVEKTLDLIQQRYKPLLRGKGVIEPDAQERWATDYREQSVLNLDEFTQVVIHCILYLNAGRPLPDALTPAQKWTSMEAHLLDVPKEELLLMALPREQVKLSRKGLRLNKLLYIPENMDGLLLNEMYTVVYSPDDLSCVFIIQKNGASKRCMLSSAFSQYKGLSQVEAEILQKAERELRGAAQKREVAASADSIQNIQQVLQGAMNTCERTRGRGNKTIVGKQQEGED